MQSTLQRLKQALLCGVSHVVPFVACGGILIAVAVGFAPMRPGVGPDFTTVPMLRLIHTLGETTFALVAPVLAGYIAFGWADRPGLVPGFVGGAIAHAVGAGFLGAIVAGFLAGFVVQQLKRMPLHRLVRPVMPILILPVLSTLVVGGLLLLVLGPPIKALMEGLTTGLRQLGSHHQILLGLVLGSMIAFDMGGPVNKAAFFFGAALIHEGHPEVMGACAAAICIPPLGLGLATLLRPRQWSSQERDSGIAALAMGAIGITEGAIPFAAADPFRVIPAIMAGSSLGAVIALLAGVRDQAPHGGLIVLPVIDHRIAYLLAIAAGSLLAAVLVNVLRARRPAPESGNP